MRVPTDFATQPGNSFPDDDGQHAKGGKLDRPTTTREGVERETEK
jgi:hypothetical protein